MRWSGNGFNDTNVFSAYERFGNFGGGNSNAAGGGGGIDFFGDNEANYGGNTSANNNRLANAAGQTARGPYGASGIANINSDGVKPTVMRTERDTRTIMGQPAGFSSTLDLSGGNSSVGYVGGLRIVLGNTVTGSGTTNANAHVGGGYFSGGGSKTSIDTNNGSTMTNLQAGNGGVGGGGGGITTAYTSGVQSNNGHTFGGSGGDGAIFWSKL